MLGGIPNKESFLHLAAPATPRRTLSPGVFHSPVSGLALIVCAEVSPPSHFPASPHRSNSRKRKAESGPRDSRVQTCITPNLHWRCAERPVRGSRRATGVRAEPGNSRETKHRRRKLCSLGPPKHYRPRSHRLRHTPGKQYSMVPLRLRPRPTFRSDRFRLRGML